MAGDPTLNHELKMNTIQLRNANQLARTANQLAYVNILLGLGLDVPKELADEIAVQVGDRTSTLAQASGS